MLIELRKGMTLHPCTFNAVIAPEKVMISALNNNIDLQRFLFLYVSGNYSLLLSSINRSSKNFEVRRAFTAHQLFTMRQADHIIEIVPADDLVGTPWYRSPRLHRNSETLPYAQRTLEVS